MWRIVPLLVYLWYLYILGSGKNVAQSGSQPHKGYMTSGLSIYNFFLRNRPHYLQYLNALARARNTRPGTKMDMTTEKKSAMTSPILEETMMHKHDRAKHSSNVDKLTPAESDYNFRNEGKSSNLGNEGESLNFSKEDAFDNVENEDGFSHYGRALHTSYKSNDRLNDHTLLSENDHSDKSTLTAKSRHQSLYGNSQKSNEDDSTFTKAIQTNQTIKTMLIRKFRTNNLTEREHHVSQHSSTQSSSDDEESYEESIQINHAMKKERIVTSDLTAKLRQVSPTGTAQESNYTEESFPVAIGNYFTLFERITDIPLNTNNARQVASLAYLDRESRLRNTEEANQEMEGLTKSFPSESTNNDTTDYTKKSQRYFDTDTDQAEITNVSSEQSDQQDATIDHPQKEGKVKCCDKGNPRQEAYGSTEDLLDFQEEYQQQAKRSYMHTLPQIGVELNPLKKFTAGNVDFGYLQQGYLQQLDNMQGRSAQSEVGLNPMGQGEVKKWKAEDQPKLTELKNMEQEKTRRLSKVNNIQALKAQPGGNYKNSEDENKTNEMRYLEREEAPHDPEIKYLENPKDEAKAQQDTLNSKAPERLKDQTNLLDRSHSKNPTFIPDKESFESKHGHVSVQLVPAINTAGLEGNPEQSESLQQHQNDPNKSWLVKRRHPGQLSVELSLASLRELLQSQGHKSKKTLQRIG